MDTAIACECRLTHAPRRVVLTGGPGAGKTAVLEIVRRSFCRHVVVLPEAASIVFGGGFPRKEGELGRRAAQRAIACVQRELEDLAYAEGGAAVVLCDRGILDGLAYWPGSPESFFLAVGMSEADLLLRYDAVVHLRTPGDGNGYDRSNPVRIETAQQAAVLDARIAEVWSRHPHHHEVASTVTFLDKVHAAVRRIRDEVPACCRSHALVGASLPPAATSTRPL
jgi:predicted ATPase